MSYVEGNHAAYAVFPLIAGGFLRPSHPVSRHRTAELRALRETVSTTPGRWRALRPPRLER